MGLYILPKSSDNGGGNSKLRRSPAKITSQNQLTRENTAFDKEFGLDSSLIGQFDYWFGNSFCNYNLADIEKN